MRHVLIFWVQIVRCRSALLTMPWSNHSLQYYVLICNLCLLLPIPPNHMDQEFSKELLRCSISTLCWGVHANPSRIYINTSWVIQGLTPKCSFNPKRVATYLIFTSGLQPTTWPRVPQWLKVFKGEFSCRPLAHQILVGIRTNLPSFR